MPNVLSGRFRTGSTCPLRTFAPGQCIPTSAIMQFRRNVYEYSTKYSAHHFHMQSEREQTLVACNATVGVNIKFPYRTVNGPYRTLKKTPSKTVLFYSSGRDAILLLYGIQI